MEALKGRLSSALGWLVCLACLAFAAGPLERLERMLSDAVLFRSLPAASDLVLIDIDEASLAAFGAWPWQRALLANLADKAAAAGAQRQVWDLILAESRAGDDSLALSLNANDVTLGVVPVIDPLVENPPAAGGLGRERPGLASLCREGTPFPRASGHIGIAPAFELPETRVGHLAPRLDADGRLRKLPAIVCVEAKAIPSLMLAPWLLDDAGAQLEAGVLPWQAPWYLRTAAGRLPLDAQGNILLDFRTPLAAYLTLPAYRLMNGSFPVEALRGKTLLLGASALGLGDRVATRLSPLTPGVAVHAELHGRLQDGALLTPLRHGWALSLLAAALISLLWVTWPAYARVGLPLACLLSVAIALALINHGTQVALVPLLAWHLLFGAVLLLQRLLEERRARRLHQRRLASIIPPALLEQLDPEAPQDIVAARRRRFGIVHGQLRNLPQFVNRADPEAVLAVFHALNRLAQQVASAHGAQLYPSEMQEFLLVWPELVPETDLSRMLAAARTLHQGVSSLLLTLESATGLALEVAVHADEALDGFIGSRERRRPVLYGPLRQVTAAMLELSTEFASPILVSDVALAGPAAGLDLRDLGVFKLEDIRRPHALYACTRTLDPLPASEA